MNRPAGGRPWSDEDEVLAREKELFETAVPEGSDRISGPFGAAPELAMPADILDCTIESQFLYAMLPSIQRNR